MSYYVMNEEYGNVEAFEISSLNEAIELAKKQKETEGNDWGVYRERDNSCPESFAVWKTSDSPELQAYCEYSYEQWENATHGHHEQSNKPSVYFDIDGTCGKWYSDMRGHSYEDILKGSTHYFRDIEPHTDVIRLAKELVDKGYDVCVMSAAAKDTIRDKWEWLEENMPFIPKENICFCPLGADKSEYVKGNSNISVLIDDYPTNLSYWNGEGIKLLNGINHYSPYQESICITSVEGESFDLDKAVNKIAGKIQMLETSVQEADKIIESMKNGELSSVEIITETVWEDQSYGVDSNFERTDGVITDVISYTNNGDSIDVYNSSYGSGILGTYEAFKIDLICELNQTQKDPDSRVEGITPDGKRISLYDQSPVYDAHKTEEALQNRDNEKRLGAIYNEQVDSRENRIKEIQSEIKVQIGKPLEFDNAHEVSIDEFKQRQLDLILRSNPAYNDISTWVRSVDDIKTFEDAYNDDIQCYKTFEDTYKDNVQSNEQGVSLDLSDDFTENMAREAIKTGKITVYSSHNIEDGAWVTPSLMEAQSYAGNDKVYQKEVNLTDIAWVDGLQGQYAPVLEKGEIVAENGNDFHDIIFNAIDPILDNNSPKGTYIEFALEAPDYTYNQFIDRTDLYDKVQEDNYKELLSNDDVMVNIYARAYEDKFIEVYLEYSTSETAVHVDVPLSPDEQQFIYDTLNKQTMENSNQTISNMIEDFNKEIDPHSYELDSKTSEEILVALFDTIEARADMLAQLCQYSPEDKTAFEESAYEAYKDKSFETDTEKMRDFKELAKEDFLAKHSLTTEEEYRATEIVVAKEISDFYKEVEPNAVEAVAIDSDFHNILADMENIGVPDTVSFFVEEVKAIGEKNHKHEEANKLLHHIDKDTNPAHLLEADSKETPKKIERD